MKLNVLSLGAGIQSTAMLLMFYDRELTPMPDFAVFADTGCEPQWVYDWLDKVEDMVKDRIEIRRVSKGNLLSDQYKAQRFVALPLFFKNPDDSQGMGRRQCTSEYKIKPIYDEIKRELGVKRGGGGHEIINHIGISFDERHRMKPPRVTWLDNNFPLVYRHVTREDCIRRIKQSWLGDPKKSACIICPYRSDKEWRDLKECEPKSFKDACDYDDYIRHGNGKMKGTQYVHRSMVPLKEVDLTDNQLDLFDHACEGMCGL